MWGEADSPCQRCPSGDPRPAHLGFVPIRCGRGHWGTSALGRLSGSATQVLQWQEVSPMTAACQALPFLHCLTVLTPQKKGTIMFPFNIHKQMETRDSEICAHDGRTGMRKVRFQVLSPISEPLSSNAPQHPGHSLQGSYKAQHAGRRACRVLCKATIPCSEGSVLGLTLCCHRHENLHHFIFESVMCT